MRAQDERLRSQAATDRRAAAAHADMAARYEEMAQRFEMNCGELQYCILACASRLLPTRRSGPQDPPRAAFFILPCPLSRFTGCKDEGRGHECDSRLRPVARSAASPMRARAS